jgi:CRISPR-associated protein (TIGR02584 family)
MSQRNILLAVTGLSPQVVTETIWALASQSPPWRPDALRLLTTRAGALAAEAGLPVAIAALARRLGHALPVPEIELITDGAGRPIDDIASDASNGIAADAITAAIRAATARPDTALHVSVAGGRKTQGCLAAMALMLFGRPQDRLSHVLVPDALAGRPDFWFPPEAMREDPVVLADIPFVRLRGVWRPEQIAPGYGAAVQAVQAAIAGPELVLDLAARTVRYGPHAQRLAPQLLAVLAWFADRRRADVGPVRWRDLDARAVAAEIGRLGGAGGTPRNLSAVLAGDPDGTWLAEKVSRLNRIARQTLGPEATPYLIRREGRRPHSAYALTTPPEAIRILTAPCQSSRAAE